MTDTSKPANTKRPRADIRGLNSLKNGARMYRLTIGELPKQLSRVTRYCRKYRMGLEAAVADAHGEVTLTMAHHVDAAAGHEQHLQVMRWLMRQKLDKMSVADVVKCSSAMAKARDDRNRAVQALNLDRDATADAIDALYSRVPTPEEDDNGTS